MQSGYLENWNWKAYWLVYLDIPQLKTYMRITVGSESKCKKLIETIEGIIKQLA